MSRYCCAWGRARTRFGSRVLLAAALWLQLRDRPFCSGLMLGLGLSAVKVLALILAPPVWLVGRRRTAWIAGFAALPLVVYLGFFAMAADVLLPLKTEGKLVTCGNLPFLSTLFGCDPAGAIGIAATLALLGLWAVLYSAAWKTGLDPAGPRVIHLITLVLITFMLLSKKAYTGYLVMGMFCLCLTMADRPFGWRDMLVYCLFSIVAVMEPTLWDRWLPLQDLRLFWQPLFAGHPGYVRLAVFTLRGMHPDSVAISTMGFRPSGACGAARHLESRQIKLHTLLSGWHVPELAKGVLDPPKPRPSQAQDVPPSAEISTSHFYARPPLDRRYFGCCHSRITCWTAPSWAGAPPATWQLASLGRRALGRLLRRPFASPGREVSVAQRRARRFASCLGWAAAATFRPDGLGSACRRLPAATVRPDPCRGCDRSGSAPAGRDCASATAADRRHRAGGAWAAAGITLLLGRQRGEALGDPGHPWFCKAGKSLAW